MSLPLDALLLLQASDVAHYASNPAPWAGLRLIFLDPGLIEEAVQRGLDPALFDYRAIPVGRHFQARAASEAMNRALAIDHALTVERERLFGEGLYAGWDHVPLRFFFLRALVARQLGQACEGQFPEHAIGLFRPTKPQQFYFDSFVSTDAFTAASHRWRIVDHYDAVAHWVPQPSAACFDFVAVARQAAAGQAHAIVHLPTVYAHLQHYVGEIARTHPVVIDLPSPHWDIALAHDRKPLVPLARMAPEWTGPECAIYRERARAILDEALRDIVPYPHARALQVDAMADHSHLQAVNFQGLRRALKGARPHFYLTEHDTGAIGPLFSVAAELGAPITVLPHSSYPTQPLPHAVGVTAIERDGFATPVRTVWGARVATRPIRFAPRRPMPERSAVSTVCLLLNTMASRGISHIDFIGMVQLHAALAALCQRHGARLLVRLKPGAACMPIVAGSLAVSQESLKAVMDASIAEVAAASDVCISHGELTSGAIDFFEAGSYVMHVSEEMRPNDLLNSSNLSTLASLPCRSMATALPHLDTLLADAARYQATLAGQREEFAARLTATDGSLHAA